MPLHRILLASLALAGLTHARAAGAQPRDPGDAAVRVMTIQGPRGQRIKIDCAGAVIGRSQVHPKRRFAVLECLDPEEGDDFYRLFDLRRRRSLRLAFASFSPLGGYGVFKRQGRSMWDPLELVPLRRLGRYMASKGRKGSIPIRHKEDTSCGHTVEFVAWMADGILRFAQSACGTDDHFDYCASAKRTIVVARNLDASDVGRTRRRASGAPPTPSPCP